MDKPNFQKQVKSELESFLIKFRRIFLRTVFLCVLLITFALLQGLNSSLQIDEIGQLSILILKKAFAFSLVSSIIIEVFSIIVEGCKQLFIQVVQALRDIFIAAIEAYGEVRNAWRELNDSNEITENVA